MALRRKSKDARVRLLSGVALFRPCTRSEVTRIASLAEEIEAPSSLIDEVPAVARRILRGMAERLRATERSPAH